MKKSNKDNQDVHLSKRELECVKYLIQGMTSREIGTMLFISKRTVETHLIHLKEKMNCRTKSELIINLIQNGIAQQIFSNINESETV